MSNIYHKCLGILPAILLVMAAGAQTTIDNSPYSRLGFGDIQPAYFAGAGGMGGLLSVYSDPFQVNLANPASLARLKATAFEVGLYAEHSDLRESQGKANFWNGNLQSLSLSFPLFNPINRQLDRSPSPFDWGMTLSLVPYSRVAYDVAVVTIDPVIDSVLYSYQGSGGTYKFVWGNGFRYKNLYGGISAEFLFGKTSVKQEVDFEEFPGAYQNIFLDETSYGGFLWNAGLQYDFLFDPVSKDPGRIYTGRKLTRGLYGRGSRPFNTNTSRLYERTNTIDLDTIVSNSDRAGSGTLPAAWGAGVMYEHVNKLRLGVDVGMERWSQYRNEILPAELLNTTRLAVGLEWVPDADSYNNYFKRVRYRAGFYTGTDPRQQAGTQLKQNAFTLGAGFPLIMPRGQFSFINLSLEAGRFGLKDGLRENFFRLTAGFTLNDNSWFFKRKFD